MSQGYPLRRCALLWSGPLATGKQQTSARGFRQYPIFGEEFMAHASATKPPYKLRIGRTAHLWDQSYQTRHFHHL